MGIEFLDKTRASRTKNWDRARAALNTADLLTKSPTRIVSTTTADIVGGATLKVGETLVMQEANGALVARRGLTAVAQISKPRLDLLHAIRESAGIAHAVVEQVHVIAGAVDLSVK